MTDTNHLLAEAVQLALEILRENNQWHINYDEGDYDDRVLEERDLAAIHALESLVSTSPTDSKVVR
jgi:hypothetical protein